MRLLDAAADRLQRRAEHDFDSMVEAVRVGTIVAADRKAFNRWQSIRNRREAAAAPGSAGLAGAALEQAMAQLAISHPDLVKAD